MTSALQRLLCPSLAAAALASSLAAAPAVAQAPDAEPSAQAPDAQPSARAPDAQDRPAATAPRQSSVSGMRLFTSDGKEIGTVIAMGLDEDNKPVLVAEIAQPLGLSPTAVAVPIEMFVRKADRIELTITEAEVNAKLKQ